MSENIIYCFSGSGNCLDMAKNIAKALGSTDIVMMRKAPLITDATGYKRVGFIAPCYGGGLPGVVEGFVKSVKISAGAYKFGIMQYAAYMGCGLHRIDELVGLDYWNGVSNHCSAIWLFPHKLTLPMTTLEEAQARSEKAAKEIAEDVKNLVKSPKKPPKRAVNAFESARFASINKLINAKMTVSNDCIGCGTCARLCPMENIDILNTRAFLGNNCIGCMACVEYCPKEAINVGSITRKRERYHNANISAEDLMKEIIHID